MSTPLSYLHTIIQTAFTTSTHTISFLAILLALAFFIASTFLIIQTALRARANEYLFKLGKGVIVLQAAFTIGTLAALSEYFETWGMPMVFGVRLTYYFYFFEIIFFVIGIKLIIDRSVRIPRSRKTQITRARLFFLLPTIALAFFIFWFTYLFPFQAFIDLSIDLLTIIGLLYLRLVLRNEMNRNVSKIAKLRLSIIKHSLTMAVFYATSLSADAIIRIIGETVNKNYYFYDLLSKLPQSVFLFLSVLNLYWSISIPYWLRKKYHLEPERFEKIQSLLISDQSPKT